jgi:GT2 family glycosyltransferase
MTRIAVAVVSYNTRDLLARCLDSLSGDERLDVWVVDNASSDGSAEMVSERFPGVTLEARDDNLGFGRAVNLVAERAAGWDFVAPANADIALEPGAVDTLLAAAEADPGAGALAPRLVLPNGATQHSVQQFWSPGLALGFQLRRQRLSPRWGEAQCLPGAWDPERARRVPWAVGAFLLVRRLAWEQAGGFDPDQWLYAEDVDLGWRLGQAGWAVRYVPDARVRHEESVAAAAAWGAERAERWMAASYDWMLRRRGPLRTRAVAAVNVAGESVRWALGRGEQRATHRRWAQLHAIGLRRRGTVRARMAAPHGGA